MTQIDEEKAQLAKLRIIASELAERGRIVVQGVKGELTVLVPERVIGVHHGNIETRDGAGRYHLIHSTDTIIRTMGH